MKRKIQVKSTYGLKYVVVDKENIDVAYNIQKEIWPEEPAYNDFLDKVINMEDNNVNFIVYDNKEVIGITGVEIYDEYPDSIWLTWFAVVPKQRRKGYGEKMLRDTINYCKKLKTYTSFRVDTTFYENRPAIYLYDKVMHLKEEYIAEDTKEYKSNNMIYTYALKGKVEKWDNKYLGLEDYYNNLKIEEKQIIV